jgi:tetratricopeptide (TPR) repeat protein
MNRFVSKAPLSSLAPLSALALVLAGGAFFPAAAQPPDPGTENVAYFMPDIETAWNRLRADAGLQELYQPREVIPRYQRFYEERGSHSAVTAIKISGVIAQLYWQMLGNRAKALQIYDWAIGKYGDLPTGEGLRRDRALVASHEVYQQAVTALPVVPAQKENAVPAAMAAVPVEIKNTASSIILSEVLAPVVLPDPAPKTGSAVPIVTVKIGVMPFGDVPPFGGASPVPVKVAPSTSDMTIASVAATPVAVHAVPAGEVSSGTPPRVALVAPPSPGTADNAPVPLPVSPLAADAPSVSSSTAPSQVLLPVVKNEAPLKLDPIRSPASAAPPSTMLGPVPLGDLVSPNVTSLNPVGPIKIAPDTLALSDALESRHLIVPINARLTALLGYLEQWRSGRMSWEQMVQTTNLSADDVILLTGTPHAVSLYSGGVALREKMGQTIRSMPELMQHHTELPVQAQVVLAESYTREKNPEAETIYKELLKKDVPRDAGWNKELLLVRLGKHYAAMGDYIKAAEANLQIVPLTNNDAWRGDSLIEAARYYMLAGQTDKATELYQQAQKATYGWAQGLALYDQAKLLISQNKHEEARALLSTPVTGEYADQVQVPLTVLLGVSYYATGDWEQARRYSERAIALYSAIQSPLPAEGLEEHVATARNVLSLIDQWSKAPLTSQPSELRVALKDGSVPSEERRVRLDLHSFKRIPIVVKSENAGIRAIVPSMNRAAQNGLDFSYAVTVQLSPEVLQNGFSTMLVVTSPDYPDYKLQVPISIVSEAATSGVDKSSTGESNKPKAKSQKVAGF